MKKSPYIISISFFLAVIASCAITKNVTQNFWYEQAEPQFKPDSPKKMDNNWKKYYSTKDEKYLENILAYVNTKDLFTEQLNERYSEISSDEKFFEILTKFGAVNDGQKIEFSYDFEMLTGFRIKSEKTADDITYLYSFFPYELFVRGVYKSTAFWSLLSNAEQYEHINIAIQKHIPYLNQKSQNNFYSCMDLEKDIGFVKSFRGGDSYSENDLFISVCLVNDIDETLKEWTSLKEEGTPFIKSTVTVGPETDFIAPFVTFSGSKLTGDLIYYDCELIHPDKSISIYKKLTLSKGSLERNDLIYTASQHYGWKFDKTDPAGNYTARLTFYKEKSVLVVF